MANIATQKAAASPGVPPPAIELVGIDEKQVFWLEILLENTEFRIAKHYTISSDPTYAAAAVLYPGTLAAVSKLGVDFLAVDDNKLRLKHGLRVPLSNPIACFPDFKSKELLIVSDKGILTRVPMRV